MLHVHVYGEHSISFMVASEWVMLGRTNHTAVHQTPSEEAGIINLFIGHTRPARGMVRVLVRIELTDFTAMHHGR